MIRIWKSVLLKIGLGGVFLLALLIQYPVSAWTQEVQSSQDNSCISCHADMQEDMENSIHSKQEIFCQSCHGGDPTQSDPELSMGSGAGFIGIPDKKQIVEKCGQCHADVETMNFYGIRTDQLAQYKTSQHGKQLFLEGDNRVAVCSDCHGYHDVLPIGDPNSSVYPLNIPKTCNACHGKEKLMAPYNLPSDIFKIYQASVHGKALLDKKDLSAASCVSCHGSHGAIPPGVRDIGTTCGKCHTNEKKYFLESIHAPASEHGRFSECISCHGNHGVQPATEALFEQACVQCHNANSVAMAKGGEIAGMLSDSEEKFYSAEASVKQASIEGIFVEPEMASLEITKTDVIAMAPLQHSLLQEKLAKLHHKVVSATKEINEEIHQKRQRLQWRKLSLIPIWIFIIVMISALWLKYRQVRSHSDKKRKDEKS